MSAAAVLAVAAGATAAAWFALVGTLAVATRARQPDPRPAGLELGGDEPPAVVNLLASGWELSPEALPATLVDLAARDVVAFEQVGDDRFVVRVDGTAGRTGDGSAGGAPPLTDYERRVLDHVRRLASGGVVPCEALSTGPAEQSRAWRRRFTNEVIADARRRGLSRPRWTPLVNAVLTVSAGVPAVLAGAVVVVPRDHPASGGDDPVGAFVAVAFVTWAVLLAIWRALRAERDTDAGLAAAGRWLGLAENLRANPTFETLPPTAAAVWDRYLAYGAALGVADATVHALALGPESDREAWSSVGGRWRLVRVRYPRSIPPGWGRAPWRNLVVGLVVSAVAGLVLAVGLPLVADGVDELVEEQEAPPAGSGDGGDVPGWVRPVVIGGTAVGPSLVLVRGLWLLAVALLDLGRHRIVTGRVLRFRRRKRGKNRWVTYMAVDDGSSEVVRAWSPRTHAGDLAQGDWVRADVTPRSGFVRSIEVVAAPDAAGPEVSQPAPSKA